MPVDIHGALFETDSGDCFLFDINTGRFLQLRPELRAALDHSINYEGLHTVSIRRDAPHHLLQELDSAYASKIISDFKPLEISHSYNLEDVASLTSTKMQMLVLELTEQCNCRCEYCVYSGGYDGMRAHSSFDMSSETIENAIRGFAECSREAQRPFVVFYGGEPLLKWKQVQEAVDLAKSLIPACGFSITTNGVLLNEQVVDFLVKNQFSLRVSLDGPKLYHDSKRKLVDGSPTFDIVMDNLMELYNRYPEWAESSVGLSTVIHNEDHFFSLSDFLHDSSWINLSLCSFTYVKAANPTSVRYSSDDRVMSNILSLVARNAENNSYNQHTASREALFALEFVKRLFYMIHMRPLRESLSESCFPGGSCIPGARRAFVTSRGEFYPCERVSTTADFCLGTVKSGLSSEKSHSMLRAFTSLNAEMCKQCWCIGLCSGCLQWADYNGLFDEVVKKLNCRNHREMMHDVVRAYLQVMTRNPQAFDFLKEVVYA